MTQFFATALSNERATGFQPMGALLFRPLSCAAVSVISLSNSLALRPFTVIPYISYAENK